MATEIKLPEDIAKSYEIVKLPSKLMHIRGLGDVDFTKINELKADKVIKITGEKYIKKKSVSTKDKQFFINLLRKGTAFVVPFFCPIQ